MEVIFVLFAICCINIDSVSSSDDRISRLEKLVEAQNLKIDRLENQLQSCKACINFQRSNNTSSLMSHQTLTSPNNQESEKEKEGLPNNRLHKDLDRNRRLLLSGTNGDSLPIIAFHAYLSKTETDPGHHHTIIFDSVLANSGNGYNNHTGAFTAPLGGMYVFAFTVVGYFGTRMPVQLVVNSNIVGATAGDSLSSTLYPSSSTVVVIHLNQNDACFLRTTTTTGWNVGNLYSSDWSRSSFSAWKL
ncbi:collagen alpha-2(VIII) chain-like [Mytilus trossulus]|uniref:collagen alpha-2(VIII) chain-like n=1 Tax=Mytilus trossulus TaxID=6551 RepID=UPI0030075DED